MDVTSEWESGNPIEILVVGGGRTTKLRLDSKSMQFVLW